MQIFSVALTGNFDRISSYITTSFSPTSQSSMTTLSPPSGFTASPLISLTPATKSANGSVPVPLHRVHGTTNSPLHTTHGCAFSASRLPAFSVNAISATPPPALPSSTATLIIVSMSTMRTVAVRCGDTASTGECTAGRGATPACQQAAQWNRAEKRVDLMSIFCEATSSLELLQK